MDLQAVIIGMISLAVFILPIIYIQRKQKNKSSKLLEEFLAASAQQQLNITRYDFWNQCYGLGLDENQKKLLYDNRRAGKEEQILINLAEVNKCKVVSHSREVNGNMIFDLIELRFTLRNPKAPEQNLEFYSKEQSMSLMGELQLAQKWCDSINDILSGSKSSDKQLSTAIPV